MNRVLIGVANRGVIESDTVVSLFQLIAHNIPDTEVLFIPIIGGYKSINMNKLVKIAKQNNCTHLLNIDSDMIFPHDALETLLKHDKDIIGGTYRYRGAAHNQTNPPSVVKFREGDEYVEGDVPETLFTCSALGLGFLLFKLDVFDKLDEPYFSLDELRPAMEDVVVCEKLVAAGYQIYCDPTIKIGHIGSYIY